jgi:hypothetical protein
MITRTVSAGLRQNSPSVAAHAHYILAFRKDSCPGLPFRPYRRREDMRDVFNRENPGSAAGRVAVSPLCWRRVRWRRGTAGSRGRRCRPCAQIIEVPGERVHAVHDHGVPVAGEPQQFRELWSCGVPAGGLVREDSVQNLAFELAFLVLIQRAHPHVPDPLSRHRCLQTFACEVEFSSRITRKSSPCCSIVRLGCASDWHAAVFPSTVTWGLAISVSSGSVCLPVQNVPSASSRLTCSEAGSVQQRVLMTTWLGLFSQRTASPARRRLLLGPSFDLYAYWPCMLSAASVIAGHR